MNRIIMKRRFVKQTTKILFNKHMIYDKQNCCNSTIMDHMTLLIKTAKQLSDI